MAELAEIELSLLAGQCLDRRIASARVLRTEVGAWGNHRNAEQTVVVWRFTTADARTKLRHLDPQFKT